MPAEKNKFRVVIDVNVWVSFAIGKRTILLRDLVLHPLIEVYASKELIEEFKETEFYEKIIKITNKYIEKIQINSDIYFLKDARRKYYSKLICTLEN